MLINNTVEYLEDGTIKFYKPYTKILHRDDGPAVIFPNGVEQYWINGEEINKDFAYLDNPFVYHDTEQEYSATPPIDPRSAPIKHSIITVPKLFVFFAVIWFIFGGIAIVNGVDTPGYSGIIISQMYMVCYYFSKVLEKKENPRDEYND